MKSYSIFFSEGEGEKKLYFQIGKLTLSVTASNVKDIATAANVLIVFVNGRICHICIPDFSNLCNKWHCLHYKCVILKKS